MSEDAAFLSALKANPADDTARLVYADWLDEHDQPHKAEYLRAVVEVARAPEDATATARLLAAVPHAELDWRLDAGARFALILDGYTDKVRTIKWLRDVTGIGLGAAKDATEYLPYTVLDFEPWEIACEELAKWGKVEELRTRLVSVAGPPHDCGKLYELHLQCFVYDRYGANAEEMEPIRSEARAAMLRMLQAARSIGLNFGEPTNRDYVLLADDLTRSECRRILALLNSHMPAYQTVRGWGISLRSDVSN